MSRELTKKFEETRRGTLEELTEYFTENEPKGEIVLVVAGYATEDTPADKTDKDKEE